MVIGWIVAGVLLLLGVGLSLLPMDDRLRRRLERNEYRPLVLHLWFH